MGVLVFDCFHAVVEIFELVALELEEKGLVDGGVWLGGKEVAHCGGGWEEGGEEGEEGKEGRRRKEGEEGEEGRRREKEGGGFD